jgi:hypothetical protein
MPGYDRTVPPGLSPFFGALNLPNISYLRASSQTFGALDLTLLFQ